MKPFSRDVPRGASAEQLFWSRLNQSVSNFCLEVSLKRTESSKIVCSLVGEELEWCGSQSFLFMASRYLGTQRKIHELEAKCKALDASLSSETLNMGQLRKQLKQAQLAAEDNDWQLQEQLAHASNVVSLEKDANNELRGKLSAAQAKLVEVEMFLNSDTGAVALQLEEELAAAKLKIAELEAEKDDLQLEMRRGKSGGGARYVDLASSSSTAPSTYRQEGKENGFINNRFVGSLGGGGGVKERLDGSRLLRPSFPSASTTNGFSFAGNDG